ncbi:hypothetical protein Ahia01_000744000 [Argonauta hians]
MKLLFGCVEPQIDDDEVTPIGNHDVEYIFANKGWSKEKSHAGELVRRLTVCNELSKNRVFEIVPVKKDKECPSVERVVQNIQGLTDTPLPASCDDQLPDSSDDQVPVSCDNQGPASYDDQCPVSCDDQRPATCNNHLLASCDEQVPVTCEDQLPGSSDDQVPVSCDDQGPVSCDNCNE